MSQAECLKPSEPVIFIHEKYKPKNPLYKNIVYVPEPCKENIKRIKAGLEPIRKESNHG